MRTICWVESSAISTARASHVTHASQPCPVARSGVCQQCTSSIHNQANSLLNKQCGQTAIHNSVYSMCGVRLARLPAAWCRSQPLRAKGTALHLQCSRSTALTSQWYTVSASPYIFKQVHCFLDVQVGNKQTKQRWRVFKYTDRNRNEKLIYRTKTVRTGVRKNVSTFYNK